MNYRHTPFEKHLTNISANDLATLKNVYEGWYVEYKSEIIKPRDLAKSLSSFANQSGGWVFFGVSEDRNLHVAESFPGIPDSDVSNALESIRNASKDLINPDVFYFSRVFKGPITSIGLKPGQSIIVVQIPEGADCPYVHNDGRIYRRIADSSDPKPETDRARLDLLIERGKQAHSRLADRVTRSPLISQGEEDQCYIHLSIISDPYETMGHWYSAGFSKFSELMRQRGIPFDNIYSKSGGYIARQTKGYIARQTMNIRPYNRVFTWEFSKHCHSFITFPIPLVRQHVSVSEPRENSIYEKIRSKIRENRLEGARIVDLNLVLSVLMPMIIRHRRLAWHATVKGPFYVKAHIQNIWRTIPFIDLPAFWDHVSEYGIPIVQDEYVLVPDGTSLDTFVVLPEHDAPKSESLNSKKEIDDALSDAIDIGQHILESFGIAPDVMAHSDDLIIRYTKFLNKQVE